MTTKDVPLAERIRRARFHAERREATYGPGSWSQRPVSVRLSLEECARIIATEEAHRDHEA